MLASGRDAIWKVLRPCVSQSAAAASALAVRRESRHFGRHPKNDPRIVDADKPMPR